MFPRESTKGMLDQDAGNWYPLRTIWTVLVHDIDLHLPIGRFHI